jgi:hypothetical protein
VLTVKLESTCSMELHARSVSSENMLPMHRKKDALIVMLDHSLRPSLELTSVLPVMRVLILKDLLITALCVPREHTALLASPPAANVMPGSIAVQNQQRASIVPLIMTVMLVHHTVTWLLMVTIWTLWLNILLGHAPRMPSASVLIKLQYLSRTIGWTDGHINTWQLSMRASDQPVCFYTETQVMNAGVLIM